MLAYYNYQVGTMCQSGAQNLKEMRGEASVCRDSGHDGCSVFLLTLPLIDEHPNWADKTLWQDTPKWKGTSNSCKDYPSSLPLCLGICLPPKVTPFFFTTK